MPKSKRTEPDPTDTERITRTAGMAIISSLSMVANRLTLLTNCSAQEAMLSFTVGDGQDLLKLLPSDVAGNLIGAYYAAITHKVGRLPFTAPMVEVIFRMAKLGFEIGRLYERHSNRPGTDNRDSHSA